MFRRLALGGVSAAAARVLPGAPQEIVSVNGPLHLYGDSHMITGCVFHVGEKVPAIGIHANRLIGGLDP
jgi:hypothetical protein